MNAAHARELDEVLTGEIRAIQAFYPQAHAALLNWGAWSREKDWGPKSARPSFWDLYLPGDEPEWAEEGEGVVANPDAERKAEAPDEPRADEKSAIELDVVIHADTFPKEWRLVVRAAYFFPIPEYQMPRHARCAEREFLAHLGLALFKIQVAHDRASR